MTTVTSITNEALIQGDLVIDKTYPGLIDLGCRWEYPSGLVASGSITIRLDKRLEVSGEIKSGGDITSLADIRSNGMIVAFGCVKSDGYIECRGIFCGGNVSTKGIYPPNIRIVPGLFSFLKPKKPEAASVITMKGTVCIKDGKKVKRPDRKGNDAQ